MPRQRHKAACSRRHALLLMELEDARFSLSNGERREIGSSKNGTRKQEKFIASTLTKAVERERKLFTELSLSSLPLFFSPHSLRCPRHEPWPSLARGTCKLIVALPIHRREKKKEKGRKHSSLLSRSCGGSVSLPLFHRFSLSVPSPFSIRDALSTQQDRLCRRCCGLEASAPRQARPPCADCAGISPPKRPGIVDEE